MKVRSWFVRYVEVFVGVVFPKKRNSVLAQRSVSVLRGKVLPVCYAGHTALLPYSDPAVKHFLYAIKYERDAESVRLAAALLSEHLYGAVQDLEMVQKMHYALCIVPVTQERKKNYGYNHLHKILNALYRHPPVADIPLQDKRDILCWTRPVRRQSGLKNRAERFANVAGAMVTAEYLSPNTVCFVVDDVTTTGATLAEARRALVAGGVQRVITLALAH